MTGLVKKVLGIPEELYRSMITGLSGRVGYVLRYRYWKKRLLKLGRNVRIETGVVFQNPGYIEIDDNCWIDHNVIILAGEDRSAREKIVQSNPHYTGKPGVVHIGKNVHVGVSCLISGISAGVHISDDCGLSANCRVYAFSHHYRSKKDPGNTAKSFGPMVPHDRQCLLEGPVVIGHNTGLALNAIVLPGTYIPENCFVMINSVVGKGRYKANSVISGSPARSQGQRFLTEDAESGLAPL